MSLMSIIFGRVHWAITKKKTNPINRRQIQRPPHDQCTCMRAMPFIYRGHHNNDLLRDASLIEVMKFIGTIGNVQIRLFIDSVVQINSTFSCIRSPV